MSYQIYSFWILDASHHSPSYLPCLSSLNLPLTGSPGVSPGFVRTRSRLAARPHTLHGLSYGRLYPGSTALHPCTVSSMILGACGFLAANLAVLLGTQCLHSKIRTGSGPVDAVLYLLL